MIKGIIPEICGLAVLVTSVLLSTKDTWAAPKVGESLKQCHTRCDEEQRVCRRYTRTPSLRMCEEVR